MPLARHRALLALLTLLAAGPGARADIDDGTLDNTGQLPLPTGQFITPTAATGSVLTVLDPKLADEPDARAGQAVAAQRSPDGKTLLVLTSGYNKFSFPAGPRAGQPDPAAGDEYVVVYDIAGDHARAPEPVQVVHVPNTLFGLVWRADSAGFYVSGGVDDAVRLYTGAPGAYALAATIPLGHPSGLGIGQKPGAGGLALTPDGAALLVANFFNDSVSVVDTKSNTLASEYDLRPFHTSNQPGVAGGEDPYAVAVAPGGRVFVSSLRDREVVALSLAGTTLGFDRRIPVEGSPNAMVLNAAGTTIYVAQDNSDQVAVIDIATGAITATIDARAPAGTFAPDAPRYTGAAPNGLALSPDQSTLYVTLGGENAVAIVSLATNAVTGLIPTAWYPQAVATDGRTLYVVHGKSDPGRNPGHLTNQTPFLTETTYPGGNAQAAAAGNATNQYVDQLEAASLLTLPVPAATDLANLTATVAANDGFSVTPQALDQSTMGFLHAHIQHVVYVIKENRTFDQVLGDLTNGANADPTLTVFGRAVTPNFHKLATNFVTLDNFFDSGEVSGDGWPWSTQGRQTDQGIKDLFLNYAQRGAQYNGEGQNRGVDIGGDRAALDPRYAARTAALAGGTANLLPGPNDDGAADGPDGARQRGYIWDAALRAGLTVRNYGFLEDLGRYNQADASNIPPVRSPATATPPLVVALPENPSLAPLTDLYFRGYDNAFPDVWRQEEWAREFAQFERNGRLPNLSLVRFHHDHMGNFATAAGGFNTPETQQADNDLAVGRLIEAVAHSPQYSGNTLVFVVEDDAQDGPDHMDAHRSTAYVAGPYVRHNAVVATRYSTVNLLRTIEDVLGLGHLNLNTAYQRPMTDVFDVVQASWSYGAVASTLLRSTAAARDPHIRFAEGPTLAPLHDAAYWARVTAGFDFSHEDRVPADLYNRVLWAGLMPGRPYPAHRTGDIVRRMSGLN